MRVNAQRIAKAPPDTAETSASPMLNKKAPPMAIQLSFFRTSMAGPA